VRIFGDVIPLDADFCERAETVMGPLLAHTTTLAL
jgi:hypothetical protein